MKKYYKMGSPSDSHKAFLDSLKQVAGLQEVETVQECDFILVFCSVVPKFGPENLENMTGIQQSFFCISFSRLAHPV